MDNRLIPTILMHCAFFGGKMQFVKEFEQYTIAVLDCIAKQPPHFNIAQHHHFEHLLQITMILGGVQQHQVAFPRKALDRIYDTLLIETTSDRVDHLRMLIYNYLMISSAVFKEFLNDNPQFFHKLIVQPYDVRCSCVWLFFFEK